MADTGKRPYRSHARSEAAERTRRKVLDAGKVLFARKGIDATTIAQIAQRAGVSEPTVYATVKSKAGLLQALMHEAIFGPEVQEALRQLEGIEDPVRRVTSTARVARAVYEGESSDLGLIMKSLAFSPELRKSQQAFERLRRKMQQERIGALFEAGRARKGLTKEAAATLLWLLTSREVYQKLVLESGWSAGAYERWLEQTLSEQLTDGSRG